MRNPNIGPQLSWETSVRRCTAVPNACPEREVDSEGAAVLALAAERLEAALPETAYQAKNIFPAAQFLNPLKHQLNPADNHNAPLNWNQTYRPSPKHNMQDFAKLIDYQNFSNGDIFDARAILPLKP